MPGPENPNNVTHISNASVFRPLEAVEPETLHAELRQIVGDVREAARKHGNEIFDPHVREVAARIGQQALGPEGTPVLRSVDGSAKRPLAPQPDAEAIGLQYMADAGRIFAGRKARKRLGIDILDARRARQMVRDAQRDSGDS